ncbi:L-amino acid N-acyltransferase YncA [Chryseolinea serpens]|uniref:L-amino acid N-acyltransferase YncA n=1 Tax=Chryseolinea serpens TaxID=947013 RepID=A0A1M5M925_9BACT|nr:GNAT family N-acetyltransferase [Chryseolinea serpens]SHG73736.1 L-amino acid N-acyltransferase YncA [Chryseolinea serpens]
MKIEKCTMREYDEIVKDIVDFWGSDRTLHSHHPYLIYEFGDTAFVIKEQGQVIAYLFGFYSQTDSLAYVHLLGVREKYQRHGLGLLLYQNFIDIAKSKGMTKIKAITTATNAKSIAFHKNRVGMTLLGQPNEEGVNVVRDYSGANKHRVVFEKRIDN